MSPNKDQALFEYLLRLGDDRLILGHRLSEWCGHGPILEEDLALGNIALDLIGHAQAFLALAGQVEGKGRSEDTLAFLRDEREFRNIQLAELPRGDFAFTIARQFLFESFAVLHTEALSRCTHAELSGLAAKFLKEHTYHRRHAAQWVIRLGDGTAESHQRIQSAFDNLWMYTGELFDSDAIDLAMHQNFGCPKVDSLRSAWLDFVTKTLTTATLSVPKDGWMQSGGREGIHTEELGPLLAQMQILPRTHPGAHW